MLASYGQDIVVFVTVLHPCNDKREPYASSRQRVLVDGWLPMYDKTRAPEI